MLNMLIYVYSIHIYLILWWRFALPSPVQHHRLASVNRASWSQCLWLTKDVTHISHMCIISQGKWPRTSCALELRVGFGSDYYNDLASHVHSTGEPYVLSKITRDSTSAYILLAYLLWPTAILQVQNTSHTLIYSPALSPVDIWASIPSQVE
jgi:hypothetical protein